MIAARDERDEGAFVVATLQQAIQGGVEPKDIAVFYRIHAQSRVLEEALRAENVPYQIVGGTRFFDRAEIKDLLAFLRVITNPRSDVDLMRIINVPVRGIGQASIDRLIARANRLGTSLYETIAHHLEEPLRRLVKSPYAVRFRHRRGEARGRCVGGPLLHLIGRPQIILVRHVQ